MGQRALAVVIYAGWFFLTSKLCHPGLTTMGWLISFLRSIACHYFLSTGNCKKTARKVGCRRFPGTADCKMSRNSDGLVKKIQTAKKWIIGKGEWRWQFCFFSRKLFLTHKNKWKKIILKFFENVLSLFLVKYFLFFVLLLLFPNCVLISMLAHG